MDNPQYNYQFRLILLGDPDVGKSSILARLYKDTFTEGLHHSSLDFANKFVEVEDEIFKLIVWGTAGQEKFNPKMRSSYYRGANGVIVVFDVTNQDTFQRVGFWINEIKENIQNDVSVVIIGNKIDLDDRRVVSTDQAIELANSLGVTYIETSVKTTIGIEQCFYKIALDLKNKLKPAP